MILINVYDFKITLESNGEKLDSYLSCPEDKESSLAAGRLIIILTHVTNHCTRTMYVGGSTMLTQNLVDARRAEQNVSVGLASPKTLPSSRDGNPSCVA